MAVRLLPRVRRETMTPTERKALRKKHGKSFEYPGKCHTCSFRYQNRRVDYPCDVIKALDWADEVLEELKGLTAHFEGIWY